MIRARVADARALAARAPAELSMYLRSSGWRLAGRSGNLVSWVRTAGTDGEFEVLQPLDPSSRDYASRVGDAVATLAVAEDRSELDILRAITEVSDDFLRSVRIGPAVEGSYTLTVHTPVPRRLAQQPPLFDGDTEQWLDEYPVARQVLLRMYAAVRAAHEAAEAALLTSDGLDPFTRAVHEGLSTNLCEALVGLGGSAGYPFEMSLSLAAVRGETARLAPVRSCPTYGGGDRGGISVGEPMLHQGRGQAKAGAPGATLRPRGGRG